MSQTDVEAREMVASWMIANGYATGHGDTLEDLLGELKGQVDRLAEDAARYRWLRERDLDAIDRGGVFAGVTPQNFVLNLDDLDAAIDAARAGAGHKIVTKYADKEKAEAAELAMERKGERGRVVDRGDSSPSYVMRAALDEIIRKYDRIMRDPPEWTNFTESDDRLKFAREAWFGAAQIARAALAKAKT